MPRINKIKWAGVCKECGNAALWATPLGRYCGLKCRRHAYYIRRTSEARRNKMQGVSPRTST